MSEVLDELVDDLVSNQVDGPDAIFSDSVAVPVAEPTDSDSNDKKVAILNEAVTDSIVGKHGMMSVLRTYKVSDKEDDEETIDTPVHKFLTDTANVSVKMAATINMGNYESVRVDVIISMPCYTEDIEHVYNKVSKYAEDKIASQIKEIRNKDIEPFV